MPDLTHATEHDEIEDKDAEINVFKGALFAIAKLDPSSKGVLRKYQIAVQTARIALGLQVK